MYLAALLPHSAPFEPDDRASLDRVLAPATPVQRAWLAGFLAGLDAGERTPADRVLPEPRAAEPLAILYASESGNCERLAIETAKLARKAGFKPVVFDFADLDVASLPQHRRIIVVAATWGEGEPPARAARAYHALMGEGAPRLDGITYGVLALGDSAYAEFCAVGRALDGRLAALGAIRAVDLVECDLDFDVPADAWIRGALKALAPPESTVNNVVAVDFAGRSASEASRDPIEAEVVEHVNLKSSRSDRETFHLGLTVPGTALAYEPGDAIEVFPQNDPALVEEILALTGLASDDRLRRVLCTDRDVTTLSVKTLETFAASTDHAGVRRLLDDGHARSWIEGRQLIDLLGDFPATLSPEHLVALTRPLPPRAYSVASSRKEVGDEAHLLIAAVRYHTHDRSRAGVASTHVADRTRVGDSIRVRLKPNRHFRLPEPSTDIIMIGPGTGVAPFRAFVQERRAVGATGRSWLFFGERRYTHDFLYQLEWQDALKDGSLSRIDLAFSRDAPRKVYVQNRLFEQRRDVVDWAESGARIYVCGDAKAMAKDVRAALVSAYADVRALSDEAAEEAVRRLEREGRYLQDVY